MYQRHRHKQILIFFLVAAVTLTVAALFAFYFSQKSLSATQSELELSRKYAALLQKIAQKRREYDALAEDLEILHEETQAGVKTDAKATEALLKRLTPKMRRLILANIPAGYPSKSRRVTSKFGWRMHPIYHQERFHHGIDFGGKPGTPVHATADGIVAYAGYSKGGYGNVVIIRHNFGFMTLYGHMQDHLQVKTGDFVKRGTVIGYLGNSGLSTGPHLHYEIKYLRRFIDPNTFLHAPD